MLAHEKKFLAALIDIAVVLLMTLVIYIFIPKLDNANAFLFAFVYFVVAFLYFFIYFLICSFLYFAWESNQSNYDGQIQDYLYDIETSIDNIYDKLEDNYALDYVSEDLMDITQYTEEIYHIMN